MDYQKYSVLHLPCVPSKPSVGNLQWAENGQLLYLSKYAVYILTPHHIGISSVREPKDTLDCFQTIIQIDRVEAEEGGEPSEVWGAAALGVLDVRLEAMTCSPSNLTANGGCIIALLTSTLDLSLWAATNNPIKGDWKKIYHLTPFLRKIHEQEVQGSVADPVIQAQVTSILWSRQPDFGVNPCSNVDASILITGTRAGALIFLRFDASTFTPHVLGAVSVAEIWVTYLALSPWTITESGKSCEATLAFGTSDGSVGIVSIMQCLHKTGLFTVFGPQHTIELSFTMPRQIFDHYSSLTALHWVFTGSITVLVKCRPGIVDLWTDLSSASHWTGYRSLPLQRQVCSLGSSHFHPVSGVYYLRAEDALIVSLFDGSFHIVHDLSTDPSWHPSTPKDELANERISQSCRSIIATVENRQITEHDVNRLNSFVPSDGYGTGFWTHENTRPTDFSYKYDTKHTTTLIAARLWQNPHSDLFLREMEETLNTASSSSGATPQHLLRHVFFAIPDHPELHSRVLELLLPQSVGFSMPIFSPWLADFGPVLRSSFKTCIERYLFGSDILLSLRMRLYLAETLCRQAVEPTRNLAFQISQQLSGAICQMLLQVLIRLLTSVISHLSERDVPFVLRIIQSASPPGSPPDLKNEAQALLDALCHHNPSIGSIEAAQASSEQCPACNTAIEFDGSVRPFCAKGHEWERCSITSFILSTPEVKICMGCRRKAFLSSASDSLPLMARSWVVEELLQAINRCLFCGNHFVVVL